MNDAVLTLRYHKLALQDSARADFTLQFVAEARRLLKDEELYLKTLEEGFRRYPQFPYFFPRLMDIYTSRGQYERALAVADSALAVNDSSQLYVFAKSSTLLRMGRYEESIVYSDRLLTLNDSLPEAYFNAGTAYVSMAGDLNPRKDKRRIKSCYQKARVYLERYRALAPKEQEKWAPLLYRIYLNLNMGKQFDEIDRLLRVNSEK
jgi:tetratricopeptide (TPR) repeat protein